MKVKGFWPQIITPKPAWYLLSNSLGALVRHNQAQKWSIINPSIKYSSYESLKILYLADFSTDWLTYLLMPSDKHNSRTARATDLISSLINAASSRDVPFHQPQELQCLHHGTAFVPSHTMPCLLCYEASSALLKLRCYGFHVLRYGAHVSWAYSPYFP